MMTRNPHRRNDNWVIVGFSRRFLRRRRWLPARSFRFLHSSKSVFKKNLWDSDLPKPPAPVVQSGQGSGPFEPQTRVRIPPGAYPRGSTPPAKTGCRAHRLAEGGSQGVTLAAPPQPVVGSAGDRISLRSSDRPTTRWDGTLPAEGRRRGSASSRSGAGPRRRPSRCSDLSVSP